MPLYLAGDTTRHDLTWDINSTSLGIVAKGYSSDEILRAFIVTQERVKDSFTLLKNLNH